MMDREYLMKLRKKLVNADKNKDLLNMMLISERMLRCYDEEDIYEANDFTEDMYRIGTVFLNAGRTEKATDILSKAVVGTQKVPHSEGLLADILNNLSICYLNTGDLDGAYSTLKNTIRIKSHLTDHSNENYLNLLCNMGNVLYDMENYESALSYHFEALNKRTVKNLSFADNLNFIGYDFEAKGEIQNAIGYFKQALAIIKSINGASSYDYIANTCYLAGVYEQDGQYEDALKLYETVVEKIKEIGKDEHPYYADALGKMSNVCVKLENYQRALMLSLKAVAISKKSLGENHIYYANSLKSAADIYVKTGDYSRAVPLYMEEVKLKKQLLGSDNDVTIASAINLCDIYLKTGESLKAQDMCQDIIKEINRNNKMYFDCLLALVRIYTKLENTELLYSVYETAKDLEPNLSFDDMLKRAFEKDKGGNTFSPVPEKKQKKRGRPKKIKTDDEADIKIGDNGIEKPSADEREKNYTPKKETADEKDKNNDLPNREFDTQGYEQEDFDSFFNRKPDED